MLSFLSNIKVIENSKPTRTGGGPKKIDRNPVIGDIRVFKNGAVYPSAALVAKFDLEYRSKGTEGGNAFDVIDSRKFGNTQHSEQPFLMIAAVPKSAPRVDLFGQVGYYTGSDLVDGTIPEGFEEGDPKNSVLDQGAATGKDLLEWAKEIYGVEPNEKGFIDFTIMEGTDLTTALAKATNGVYYLPKKQVRGEGKGTWTVQKRENIVANPLVPTSVIHNETTMTGGGASTDEGEETDYEGNGYEGATTEIESVNEA